MQNKLDARRDFLRKHGIPEQWRPVTLGEVADLVGGGTPSRDEGRFWQGGTIPWATPTDLTANESKYISQTAESITRVGLSSSAATLLPVGSILYTSRATIGAKAIASVPIATNQGFASFIPCEIDGQFLYYLLDELTPIIKRLGSGTTFDEVSKRDIRKVHCAIPVAKNEQTAIARILDAVDTTIEQTREAVERSRQLRKSLIAELLSFGVDTNGQVRDSIGAAKQIARTPLGLLPIKWRLSTVGAEFDLQNGFTLNENRRPRYLKRRYLRVANVQRDALMLDDIQELEASDAQFAPRVLEVNDLLVVEGHADRMQIGRCAKVTEEAQGLTFQNHLFRLRTSGGVLPYFGCLWLNSTHAQRYWNARCATSSGLNTINQRMLKRLIVPVPPKHEQQIITDIVSAQRKHLETLVAKQNSLESLKKSLMHDLLTGTVRVGDNFPELIKVKSHASHRI